MGRRRTIAIGPKGQLILRPFLESAVPGMLVFRNSRGRPVRRNLYANAIDKAAAKAQVSHWSPNQLRHTYATAIRKTHGLEAAQVVLGHSSPNMTLTYAQRDLNAAVRIAAEVG